MHGVRLFALSAVAALGLAPACSSGKRLHGVDFATGGAGGNAGTGIILDSGTGGPPPPDASGYCGNQFVPVVIDRPNLYFVIDASGSMTDTFPPDFSMSKYNGARVAIANVLRAIGHRVNYGAAIFPVSGGTVEGCAPGKEIFPTTPGDPSSFAASGVDGPVLKSFITKTGLIAPEGGTPTAATFVALTPALETLPGKTFVILATDGAPNCDLGLTCGAQDCEFNIEGASIDGVACIAPVNCCDEAQFSGVAGNCVDKAASAGAIAQLEAAGVPTYVVGMPGTEAYVQVLNAMAEAGGTARPGPVEYYATTDVDALSAALKEIGVKIAVSCDVKLDSEPPDPKLVNVYFDQTELDYDPVDGWSWTSPTSITINGAACDKLKSGDVLELQVVAGCPTKIK